MANPVVVDVDGLEWRPTQVLGLELGSGEGRNNPPASVIKKFWGVNEREAELELRPAAMALRPMRPRRLPWRSNPTPKFTAKRLSGPLRSDKLQRSRLTWSSARYSVSPSSVKCRGLVGVETGGHQLVGKRTLLYLFPLATGPGRILVRGVPRRDPVIVELADVDVL